MVTILIGTGSRWMCLKHGVWETKCLGKCQNGSRMHLYSSWNHLNGRPPSSISPSTHALRNVASNVPQFVFLIVIDPVQISERAQPIEIDENYPQIQIQSTRKYKYKYNLPANTNMLTRFEQLVSRLLLTEMFNTHRQGHHNLLYLKYLHQVYVFVFGGS